MGLPALPNGGPLRPWIAPALGVGLIVAGVAMGLGMSTSYGPTLGVVVAAMILSVGHWRITRGRARQR